MATVLIVEDDPDMRELERTALGFNGYEVVSAGNGAEGLQCLQDRKPCVILLDLMMPVLDGLGFLSERKRQHLAPDVPVVCVSAAGPELLSEAIRLGAAECLHKPADFEELCATVDRHCLSRATSAR